MTTLNNGTNWSPRLAVYGDMGSTNAQSLSRLINETNAGHFDAILHIGKHLKYHRTAYSLLAFVLPGTPCKTF